MANPIPRSWPRGPVFCAAAFTDSLLSWTGRLNHARRPASKGLAEPERDDAAVDEAARKGVRGDDLDAVEVAQEPLEVDEDARADRVHLLEPGQVVDRSACAERGIVEQPGDQRVRQLGEDERRLVPLRQRVRDLDGASLTPPGELDERRRPG